MSSSFVEALFSLGVALIAGFLVGAEREKSDCARFAGARTFPLFALAGALGAMLGVWVLVAVSVALGALISAAYYRNSRALEHAGMSTEVAAVVTFCIGALCTSKQIGLPLSERLLLAAAVATATLALLSFKEPLHGFVARISQGEVYAATKLLLLSVILLPLLPNQNLGPWGALNPRTIGLLVVLIATIGFVGYVAIRVLGMHKGVGLTGLLGGIASSLAVTFNFAGRARQNREVIATSAVAIVLASGMMFARVLVEIYVVAPGLSWTVFWPLAGASASALAIGAVLYRQAPEDQRSVEAASELNLQNPFSLSSAFRFAALFVAVMLVCGAGAHYFKSAGVYLSAALTGLASVHAVSLSFAQMYSAGRLEPGVTVNAIGFAVAANTLFKIGIASFLGGPRLAVRVAPPLLAALCAGALIHWFLY